MRDTQVEKSTPLTKNNPVTAGPPDASPKRASTDSRDYFAGTVSRGFAGGVFWNVSQSVRILSQPWTDKP